MADAVTKVTIDDNAEFITVHLTNISDSVGESAVQKIDKSAIGVARDGAEAASLDLEEIRWAVQGFTSVRLLWDHDTDDVCMVLSGNGYQDFSLPDSERGAPNRRNRKDPRSTGGTGDILLTTAGAVSGATYDIWAKFRKSSN